MSHGSTPLALLDMEGLPRDVFVRQQKMPAEHHFPAHSHQWHQLLYAISGVLVVTLPGERIFVPPQQAVWLPSGVEHSVYSEFGADLKSLYIDRKHQLFDTGQSIRLKVSPLLRELIMTASSFDAYYPLQGYEARVMALLLETLARQQTDSACLPWPEDTQLFELCNRLYRTPDDRSSLKTLAQQLNVSDRTLERRFRQQTGMSLQSWRGRLRVMKAIELLATDMSITQIALELGYSSPSPFIFMFRERMSMSPAQYRKQLDSGAGKN